MVEFALAIPFLLLVILSIIWFGRAFYVSHVVLHAAQEGARMAARIPNLNNPTVRDSIRGFTVSGGELDSNSVVYSILGSALLLSGGRSGDLPPGSSVKILPWDGDGSAEDYTPPGTVAVKIEYPYVFVGDPFSGGPQPDVAIAMSFEGNPVPLPNFLITERATIAQEIYQEVN